MEIIAVKWQHDNYSAAYFLLCCITTVCPITQKILIQARAYDCKSSSYSPTIVVKIKLNAVNDSRELTINLQNPPLYGYVDFQSYDPWRPFQAEFCCSPYECITNEAVEEVTVIEGLECKLASIITFLPNENKLTPLSVDFGLRDLGPNCTLTLV